MVKQYRSPGPKYGAPNTVGYENNDLRLPLAPAYSLGKRLQGKLSGRVPGPKYDLSNVTHRGPIKTPAAFLASRFQVRAKPTPGPAAYNTVPCTPVVKPAMPMYSIGIRRDGRRKFTRTPAPNAYALSTTIGNQAPELPSVPMYTIPGRTAGPGRGGRAFASPGPARYSAVPVDQFKRQTPRPVMLGRADTFGVPKGRRTPAPNAYFPAPSSRFASAPQYSMAERIPDRADPYLTPADRVPDWE